MKLSKGTLEYLRRLQGTAPSSPAGTGELTGIDKKIDFTIVPHAREIQSFRCRDIKQSKNYHPYYHEAESTLESFLTADFALYVEEDGKIALYMAERENNLIFKYPDEAIRQFRETGNFFPPEKDIGAVISAESTLRIVLSELFDPDKGEIYFSTYPEGYKKLTPQERGFAELVHGRGNDFIQTMKILWEANVRGTWIRYLTSESVKSILEKNNAKSLGRTCILRCFSDQSTFDAFYTPLWEEGLTDIKLDFKFWEKYEK